MILLPQPRKLSLKQDIFSIRNSSIVIDVSCDSRILEITKILQKEVFSSSGIILKITKSGKNRKKGDIYIKQLEGESEAYQLNIEADGVYIIGEGYSGVFYAVQTLIQIVKQQGSQLKGLNIEDYPEFKSRGFMLDVTRGNIPTLETLKELVDRISFLKINQLQLYIEHSFAFSKHSEVWAGMDVLTPEDILTLDEYCKKRCVELVPCMQTFGHLYHVLNSESYKELCELDFDEGEFSWCNRMHHHTLNVSDPRSLDFVKEMLDEFIPLFTSDKFNICCDETFDLGKGKSGQLVEKKGIDRVYIDFLKQVYEYVADQGKKVMFWGDMLLNSPEFLNEISNEAIILNWDYSKNPKEDGVKALAQANLKQYVCPGTHAWNALIPNFNCLKNNIPKMINYGCKYNVEGVLNTNWGDYGNINPLSSLLPGMAYGAALSWNNSDTFEFEKEINNAISFFTFGDKSQKIADIIEELSQYEVVKWGDIVNWLEKDSIENFDWVSKSYKERIESWTEAAIKHSYQAILGCVDRISDLYGCIKDENKIDFLEINIASRGTALMQLIGQLILKEEKLVEEPAWIILPTDLAILIEKWFNEYMSIWRMRSKESELFRLRSAILKITKIARSIGKG